jgi:hypothetical protein
MTLGTEEQAEKAERRSKKQRINTSQELCQNAFEGKARAQVEKMWTASKRFKVSRVAKAIDVDSTFNPTAVGALGACEGDLGKGEVGLLCGASSTRRRQQRVRELALKFGWSHSPEVLAGEGWSWGSDEGTFTRGVNLHTKLVCHDLRAMLTAAV